jgi:HK97 family phage portal protein
VRLLDRVTTRPAATPLSGDVRGVQVFNTWQRFHEDPLTDFRSYVEGAYHGNGAVFSLILARMLFLSEARFKYRRFSDKGLFGGPSLLPLERPWPGGTTGELIARMEQDASLAGNAYVYMDPAGMLQRLRPDRVRIQSDGQQVTGYWYTVDEGGEPIPLPLDRVVHWSPIPDPLANFRGMSWVTPVARDLMADTKMSRHKDRFFENAAVPGLVIKVEKTLSKDEREVFEEAIARRHQGVGNAYKTMLVEGGADVEAVGADMEQASFVNVQAAGENRLAAAAGVPPIVVGFKEGLQSATYSNYAQALRRFADLTIRPLWRSMSASLEKLVVPPAGSELWYDDRDIPALQQDAKDQAEVYQILASAAGQLIRVGYDPDLVAAAIGLPDIPHTGGIPVTLYPEGQDPDPTLGAQAPEDQTTGAA